MCITTQALHSKPPTCPSNNLIKVYQPGMSHAKHGSCQEHKHTAKLPHLAGAQKPLSGPEHRGCTPAATMHSSKTNCWWCQGLAPFKLHRWVRTAGCGEGEGGGRAARAAGACWVAGSNPRPGGLEASALFTTALHLHCNCKGTKLKYIKCYRHTTRFRNVACCQNPSELYERAVCHPTPLPHDQRLHSTAVLQTPINAATSTNTCTCMPLTTAVHASTRTCKGRPPAG